MSGEDSPSPESNATHLETFGSRVWAVFPDIVTRHLTVKLLLLLLLGTLVSGAVVVVSFMTIQDQVTGQAQAQVESETSLQASIYANWLTERWTTLTGIADADELQHDSETVVHQWLVAEQTDASNDVHALLVVDVDSGDVIGSSDTTYEALNLYDEGLDPAVTAGLLSISNQPHQLADDQPEMTLIGTQAGDRMLFAAVPANTTVVESATVGGGETALYSLSGERLVGDETEQTLDSTATVGDSTLVMEDGDYISGRTRIAHDLLSAEPVRQYDENTTVGTVVVTRAPKDEVYTIRNEVSRDLVLTFGLTFILLIGTAGVTMRSVTGAVNRLSDRARRISQGSFDVAVESSRRDELGTLSRSVGEMRDSLRKRIEEAEQREQQLQEREEKYRNLFEETHDALMLLDRDGFFDCNETTLELFGADSVEEFIEYTPWELSPPTQEGGEDSKDAAQAHMEEAFEEGEAFFEWTHRRLDGTEFPAVVKLSRFHYEGEPALHALVRDITERKEYERRLQRQRDNLEILNQMVRHDIRNNLQMVISMSEVLTSQDHVDDEATEYVETILENVEHAVDLTKTARDLADVMQQESPDHRRVDVASVVESEVDNIQSAAEEAVVTIEEREPRATVQADDMLNSVFRNLLKNAVQHNDKDVPKIAVSVAEHEESVQVRIADNGPGVPDDQQEKIFGKGEKGLESEGTGIGLYLVHTLVDRYGGDIWVENRAEQPSPVGSWSSGDGDPEGAVFIVELPKPE